MVMQSFKRYVILRLIGEYIKNFTPFYEIWEENMLKIFNKYKISKMMLVTCDSFFIVCGYEK